MSLRNIDFASLLTGGLAAAGGGVAQRMGWNRGMQTGWLVTAGTLIGGVALKSFSNNAMLGHVGEGLFHSGATIAGWQGFEQFQGSGAAGRIPGGRRMANPLGRGHASHPQVSVSTANPRTGEEVLVSRV